MNRIILNITAMLLICWQLYDLYCMGEPPLDEWGYMRWEFKRMGILFSVVVLLFIPFL